MTEGFPVCVLEGVFGVSPVARPIPCRTAAAVVDSFNDSRMHIKARKTVPGALDVDLMDHARRKVRQRCEDHRHDDVIRDATITLRRAIGHMPLPFGRISLDRTNRCLLDGSLTILA